MIFLLESPHKDELKYGAPVCGYSGRKMTKTLFSQQCSLPLGRLLLSYKCQKTSNAVLGRLGLMNVCPIPMQKSVYDKDTQDKYKDFFVNLDKMRKTSRKVPFSDQQKREIEELLLDHLRNKLDKMVGASLTIIPCGKFAQRMFQLANISCENWRIISGIPHPSSRFWCNRALHEGKFIEVMEAFQNLCEPA
jgi:hypothetical protein